MSNSFLKEIATIYATHERENIDNYCFVFPNKRSSIFFTKYLTDLLGDNYLTPEITTISDFVRSFSDFDEASRYESLFTIYKEYLALQQGSGKQKAEINFDEFLFWDEMLVNDFNDVDRYLVNPESLFVNIERLKEIESNYLTDHQREVIKRYWGIDVPGYGEIDSFWKHVKKEKETNKSFLKIWEVLNPLYNAYIKSLNDRQLTTAGLLYRNAFNQISEHNRLSFDRYIFIGFNVLSTSEFKIFSKLQQFGMADFYWDYNSAAFAFGDNRGKAFIERNIKIFPSRYQLTANEDYTQPNIEILGIPSNIGQTKIAANIVEQLIAKKEIKDPNNAINTAIVLPNESLFIPLAHSLPDKITSFNVTMGYPMKNTPIASIIGNIFALQRKKSISKGNYLFFYEDIIDLLSDPLIKSIDQVGADRMIEHIRSKHLFSVSAQELCEKLPCHKAIFTPLPDITDLDQVEKYIEDVIALLKRHITPDDKLQHQFLDKYSLELAEIVATAKEYDVNLSKDVVFNFIRRAVNSSTQPLTGLPLEGLQIMGVLETRSLDFDNVIVLSLNERIFPRRLYTRSFIPDALRRCYGMATIDMQESIFSYYFYRMLSRAKNAYLVYDARTVGNAKSNELSRYLSQILYTFPADKVAHKLGIYGLSYFEKYKVEVEKDDRILGLINRYRDPNSDKFLSASAINMYINCPLQFYLNYVEDFSVEDEIYDFIDAAKYGTIIHNVAQTFYDRLKGNNQFVVITAETLNPYTQKDNPDLAAIIRRTINKEFNKLPDSQLDNHLVGECLMMASVIQEIVRHMLRRDMNFTPFEYHASEYKTSGRIKISDDLTINAKMAIDRIDVVNGLMRFIDYKTGEDEISSNFDDIFNPEKSNRAKAIVQLLMYCSFYKQIEGTDRPIMPLIYQLKSIIRSDISPITLSFPDGNGKSIKHKIYDYHDVEEQFNERFYKIIESIFDPEVKFTQAKNTHSCKFCNFKQICGVTDE